MRIKRRNEKESPEGRGVSAGCLGIVFEVGVWVLSTVFMAVGGALFVFGVFTFEPEITAGTVFAVIGVPVAIIIFIRTGRAIVRDLRNRE